MDFYMLALDLGKAGTYNVGTDNFGTLRHDLEELIHYAGSGSKVRSLPEALAINTLRILHFVRLSPLVPWHYLTYHKECYFDVKPLLDLGWRPNYSNSRMLAESYDWYCQTREPSHDDGIGSPHRSPLKQRALWLLKKLS